MEVTRSLGFACPQSVALVGLCEGELPGFSLPLARAADVSYQMVRVVGEGLGAGPERGLPSTHRCLPQSTLLTQHSVDN
jgi:hypothetical protein